MDQSNLLFSDLLVQTVDTDAIAHNVATIKKLAGVSQLMAVVKADGYSQGADQVARAAIGGGATQLGVATLSEALKLRESITLRDEKEMEVAERDTELSDALVPRQIPILAWIWHPEQKLELEAALVSDVELGIPSIAHARAVAEMAQQLQCRPRVTLMIDSGLNRSGFSFINGDFEAALPELVELHKTMQYHITGAFTHFACADEPSHPSIDMQAERFRAGLAMMEAAGLTQLVNHAANSPAALTRPDLAFDMVRPGLAIYGGEPIAGMDHGLRPVMRWEAKVTVVKRVPEGESVSYGQTWTAPRDTNVAIVPCGYADGMMRSGSDKIEVSIRGKRYAQIGRVCMDQFVVDVGPDTDVTPEDVAVIVGGANPGEPTMDELAGALGTINYEVLTAPKGRTQRRYVGTWA